MFDAESEIVRIVESGSRGAVKSLLKASLPASLSAVRAAMR